MARVQRHARLLGSCTADRALCAVGHAGQYRRAITILVTCSVCDCVRAFVNVARCEFYAAVTEKGAGYDCLVVASSGSSAGFFSRVNLRVRAYAFRPQSAARLFLRVSH